MHVREPLAASAIQAIQTGDAAALTKLLTEHAGLATVRLVRGNSAGRESSITLLHVATDWPGHFPNGVTTVATLLAAGADVNARCDGPHTETPLHWAASSDDVEVLDALLDAGAEIEAGGGVIGQGTPLDDAVAFGQWQAARRLVERGTHTRLWHAAALGLMDRLAQFFVVSAPPRQEVTEAFWSACHGGQQGAAEYLLERGADLNWIGYDKLTPLDAAQRSGAPDLVNWLRASGGTSNAAS
jgi:ankyrin repeat protein